MGIRRPSPEPPAPPACGYAERVAELEARTAELEETVGALSRALGNWQRHPGAVTATSNIAAWCGQQISDEDLNRIGRAVMGVRPAGAAAISSASLRES